MLLKTVFLLCAVFIIISLVDCHPTLYKYNENNKLEPDLIPVSSTVIPLPVYQVSYGVDVASSSKGDTKSKRPDGPIPLITVHNKKKFIPAQTKPKYSDASTVKQVSKKDFEN